jgi:hypothetical protein
MPKMTKAQIKEALGRGEHIAVGAHVLRRNPRTLRPDPGDLALAFASPPDPERPDEFEAVTVRGVDGRLTRAGMEHAIRSGGSVLWGGEVVTDLAQIPDEVGLAEGDRERLRAHAEGIDRQIAELNLQWRQAQEALDRAPEPPKAQGPPAGEPAQPPPDVSPRPEEVALEAPPAGETPPPEPQPEPPPPPEEDTGKKGKKRGW